MSTDPQSPYSQVVDPEHLKFLRPNGPVTYMIMMILTEDSFWFYPPPSFKR